MEMINLNNYKVTYRSIENPSQIYTDMFNDLLPALEQYNKITNEYITTFKESKLLVEITLMQSRGISLENSNVTLEELLKSKNKNLKNI